MFISLMEKPGLVNLDFADIVAILRDADGAEEEKGDAMMGTGRAGGEDSAMRARRLQFLVSCWKQNIFVAQKAAMVQVSGGEDMTLTEIDGALHFIRSQIEDDASDRPQPSNIIFGATFDNTIPKGELQISVVATGIKRVEAASPKIEASHLTEVLPAEEKTGSSPLDHLEPEPASSIEDFYSDKNWRIFLL